MLEKGEEVYTIGCSKCEKTCIRETKRKLKTRVKEHREEVDKLMEGRSFTGGARKKSENDRRKSAIMDHAIIVETEKDWDKRSIREVITIRKHLAT